MFNKYGRVRGSRLPLTQSVVLNCGGALSQHKGVYARLRGRWGAGASTNAAALGHARRRDIRPNSHTHSFDCPQASKGRRGLLTAELAERTLPVLATPERDRRLPLPVKLGASCVARK